MNEKGDNSERLISCSFCNEKVSPSTIGEHLMMCGNKTDECPNCKKFIRRAVFAYHYENNCTNLNESEADIQLTSRQTNNASQSSSGLATNDKTYSMAAGNTSQGSNLATRATVQCSFCDQQCDLADCNIHEERCVRNPTNITRKQQPPFNGTVNRNSDQLHHVDQFNDMTAIPCDYCGKSFEWRHFEEHVHTCATQYYERRQDQSRPTDIERNKRYTRCKYCNKDRFALTIKIHEKFCTGGYYSAAPAPRYYPIDTYYLPPLYHSLYRTN